MRTRLAFLAGVIVALILAIFCEWVRAIETIRNWQQQEQSRSAGPGRCRFIGPVTGQCACTRFVRSGEADGNCRSCHHPGWVHAD